MLILVSKVTSLQETQCGSFVDAGASGVRAFQTNGTVLFTAADPSLVAARARDGLRPCGYDDAVFVRDRARLTQIIDQFPDLPPESDHYREMVVLFDHPDAHACASLPREREGLLQVLRVEHDHALGLIWKPKSTAGNITGHLEHRLDTVATSRTLGTVQRLLTRL